MMLSHVLVVHGYSATPDDHWFRSLAASLESHGIRVDVPKLPDPATPDKEAWVAEIQRVLGVPDEGTAVVAHSLGSVAALHALDRTSGSWSLGAFVSVAGFISPPPRLPELDSFTTPGPDLDRTAARTLRRAVILSDNDDYVPAGLTLALAEGLRADVINIPAAGHFLADDGITSMPRVAEHLLK